MAKRLSETERTERDCNARLVESIDRLGSELRVFRDVVDELRDSLTWITRNGVARKLSGTDDTDPSEAKSAMDHEKASLSQHAQLMEYAIEGLSTSIQLATHEEIRDCFDALTTVKFKAELALEHARKSLSQGAKSDNSR